MNEHFHIIVRLKPGLYHVRRMMPVTYTEAGVIERSDRGLWWWCIHETGHGGQAWTLNEAKEECIRVLRDNRL